MNRLRLSIAVGDYDRTRPLLDGAVQIDGVHPIFMALEPEEIFFRAFRHAEFDVCELSLSTFAIQTAAGQCPYVGTPIFPSRAFRHTSIYIRTDRGINTPADLKGKRIGVPEYQLTANVWARMILQEEHGVSPFDIIWIRGAYEEESGRSEKVALNLPPKIRIQQAPVNTTISSLLANGDIDALIGPRMPSCFEQGHPQIGWLYADPISAAANWFRKRHIFPIMHLVGIRRTLASRYTWLPAAVCKAFEQAKAVAIKKLADTSVTKVTLPFVEEQLRAARDLMGRDFWTYGFHQNRSVLETFLRHHHAEGLSSRLLNPEELFPASTLELCVI